jgi:cytochrome c553
MRSLTWVLVLASFHAASAHVSGQATEPWANKLFGASANLYHDFGAVQQGTQLRHEFEVTNIYQVPLEIIDLRCQSGPAQVSASKTVLQPNEKTTIVLTVDTERFIGTKTSRIFVTFGPKWISTAILTWTAVSEANGRKADPNALRTAAMNNGGDPKRGKALFLSAAARCTACHKVQGQGGDFGPDLSHIGGKLDRNHLIESILDPSAEIFQGNHATIIETKTGLGRKAYNGRGWQHRIPNGEQSIVDA